MMCQYTLYRTAIPILSALSRTRIGYSILVVAVILANSSAWAQTLDNPCDSLAAAPFDSNRSVSGIPFARLDAAAAIPACERAASSYPNIPRFKFQLARALDKSGRHAEAAALYDSLVAQDYIAAIHNLSVLYFDGTGVTQNKDKALSLLQRAAELGYPPAQFQLGLLYARGQNIERDLSKARDWYSKAAAQGNTQAQNELGFFYEHGLGVDKDLQKAAEFYQKSSDAGYVLAKNNLGRFYLLGIGVARNPNVAAKLFSAAADQENAWAQNELGLMYQNGIGVSQDDAKALELYKKSAAQGFAAAEANVGSMYLNGLGVAQDKTEAAKWYATAADHGNAGAQEQLGLMYQNGIGVSQDDAKALELYKKSAAQGFAVAEANVGWMYLNGRGVAHDKAEAAKWYATAAEHGNAWAQNQLGLMYQNGVGVKQDDTKALELYKQAAAQRFAVAEANAGLMYFNGRGVARDKSEAAKWYAISAKHGNGWAMAALAWMYNNPGNGVSADSLTAYILYRLAVNAGNHSALLPLAQLCATGFSWNGELFSIVNGSKMNSADSQLSDQEKLESTISHDAFLAENPEIARDALVRNDDKSLMEAVGWYQKAIATGSVDAILQLANLYLTYDPANLRSAKPAQVYSPFSGLVSPGFEKLVGSAAKAADLYAEAITKGSNAARINLGTLYELGFGVPKDLDKARSLYTAAISSTFDAKAQLGLLRIDLNSLWDNEVSRALRFVEDINLPSAEEENKSNNIVIESIADDGEIEIRDNVGARVFSGMLKHDEPYVVPANRSDLILWTGYKIRIRVDGQIINVPREFGDGIRLNRKLLLNGGYLVERSDQDEPIEVPRESIEQSRVTLEALSDVDLYVHSEDHVIGFHRNLVAKTQFHVPRIQGLMLELKSSSSDSNEDKSQATIAMSIDGAQATNLTVPTGCLLTLALDPDKLGKITTSPSRRCEDWVEGAPPSAYIIDSSGNSIGFLKRLPDEKIPKDPVPGQKVVAGFLGINRALALFSLRNAGRWDEALRAQNLFFNEDMRDHGPNSLDTLEDLLSLCDLEIREGQDSSARNHLDRAIQTIDALGNIPASTRVTFFRNFGSLLSRLGRYSEAERFLILANELQLALNQEGHQRSGSELRFDELSETREKIGDLDGAIVYQLRALLQSSFNGLESSERYDKETGPQRWIRLIDLLNRTDRRPWSDKLLTFVHDEAKREFARDLPEPLKFPLDLSNFENTFGRVDRSDLLAIALGDLGQVYSWMGRHEEALPLLEQQARTRKNVFGESSPEATATLAKFADELRLSGRGDEALAKAREGFSLALQYANRNKESSTATVDILNIPATTLLKAEYSNDGITLADDAFEVAQHVVGSAAAKALQALGARLAQADPSIRAFVRQRQDLNQQINRLDADLVAAISSDPKFANPKLESELRQKIKSAEASLQTKNSTRPARLAKIDELDQPSPVSYKEVRSLLQPDEALVIITVGNDSTFVFVATADNLRWVQVDVGGYALDQMVATLRCGLDPEYWSESYCRKLMHVTSDRKKERFDASLSYTLYRQLFGKIEDTIRSKPRLSLVLSGALTSLPPQVFVTSDPTGKSPQQIDWIVRTHAVTVLPSVASLKVLRGRSTKAAGKRPLIGFANPVFDPYMPNRKLASSGIASRSLNGSVADVMGLKSALPPLPDTATELREVAASVKGNPHDIILGDDATESRVKRERLDQYRIIYFATHGLLADQVAKYAKLSPEPALALSLPKNPTEFDDGLLTASEVAQLKIDADWVVLSACNTAAGDKPGAEALSGLARAFFYAGGRSLLVSNWAVPTESTVALMEGTFVALAADPKLSHAEALQKSMLATMENPHHPEWANPTFWAPFIVVGEPAKSVK
jgi:TPR repeat protein/CHAT domain-containing protein